MMETPPDHWLFVTAPLWLYFGIVMGLFGWGGPTDAGNPLSAFFRSISEGLRKLTGYPGWAMAGALSCLLALATAAVGLYWDVAFHIDFGRDEKLFTPSHTMIVAGLAAIAYSAGISVLFATLDKAPVGFRLLGLRVPYSAVPIAVMGIGALTAFPLDNMWHEAYGIDITLWSPTHLMLVAGGALATIPAWLMLHEAKRQAEPTALGRGIVVMALGAVLVGLSTPQGEFDFGVPQFQVLYLPVLIAFAAGFTFVLARSTLGRGGALSVLLAFLIIRGLISLFVAGTVGHTFPRFPLYLASALVVEAIAWWLGTDDRLRFGLAAGAAVGTLGIAGELAWVSLSGWGSGQLANDVARFLLVVPASAVAAGVIGAALAQAVPAGRGVPAGAAVLAGLVFVGALLFLLPRNTGRVDAVIRLTEVGRRATVEVELDPPDAAERASAFGVVAWQGGGRVSAGLEEIGPGRYVSDRPLPITGTWKTVVGLQRADEVMVAPVYFPADPEIDAPAIPALAERRTSFVRNTTLLLREQHDGPTWPSVVGYGSLASALVLFTALVAFATSRIGRRAEAPPAVGPSYAATAASNGNGQAERDAGTLADWRAALEAMRTPTG